MLIPDSHIDTVVRPTPSLDATSSCVRSAFSRSNLIAVN
nr:MAG TPA: hypothetical protein [Caudoviricetes sp.]